MKKLTTLLMTLLLMSGLALRAEETITVSANSSDISEGLDLKVVAKLFAEAKNLEEFETLLNTPDNAFCNLDLNGDGQVDYLRVVETGQGNKRLIVLQAVLAKDIYQDVASIYVEKDENNEVSVQVVGDEYIYGTNYIIEPVYVYRPVIYDWFWCDAWYAWHSPWYWGYYPHWWYVHSCYAHDWYWRHCYDWHHQHYYCSFRHAHHVRSGYHDMHRSVSRREYAVAHPDRSFERRNSGYTNARQLRNSSHNGHAHRDAFTNTRNVTPRSGQRGESRTAVHSEHRGESRSAEQSGRRPTSVSTTRSTANTGTASRTTSSTNTSSRSTGSTNTASRTTSSTTRSTSTTVRQPRPRTDNVGTPARSANTSTYGGNRSSSSSSTTRSTSSSSTTRTSSSGGSYRSSGGYSGASGGSSRSGGGSVSSGGGARSGGGGASGSTRTRR